MREREYDPYLMFGFLPMTVALLTVAGLLISWWTVPFFYAEVGFLIWVVCEGAVPLWRALLFWMPSLLLGRPELVSGHSD